MKEKNTTYNLYTLKNDFLEITISNLGATIHSITTLSNNKNLIVSYLKEEDYLYNLQEISKVNAPFSDFIDSGEVTFQKNKSNVMENVDDLSEYNFLYKVSKKVFDVVKESNELVFKTLVDTFNTKVFYSISFKLEKNSLIITHNAKSEDTTIFYPTNDLSFFMEELEENSLYVGSEYVCYRDKDFVCRGKMSKIENDSILFTEKRNMKDDMYQVYLLQEDENQLVYENSLLNLTVSTQSECLTLKTIKYNSTNYSKGFLIRPTAVPNGFNSGTSDNWFLKKNVPFSTTTTYTFNQI